MEKMDVTFEQKQESYMEKAKRLPNLANSGIAIGKWLAAGVTVGIFGVLWGKAAFVELLYPVGMVYLSFFLGEKVLFWVAWLGVAIGSLQVVPMQSWAVLASGAAIQMTLGNSLSREATLKKALLCGFAMALSGGFYAIGQGGLIFYFALAAVEVALVVLLSLFGQTGILFLWQKNERNIPTKEEILSLCFCLACGLGGLTALSNPVLQQGVLACSVAYAIGFCGWREGAGSASAVAMVLGFVLYLCGGISMLWFLTFAISGLVGGVLGRVGKIPVVMGMVFVPMVFLFYHKNLPVSEYIYIGWILGLIALLCTPKKFLASYSKVLWHEEEWKNQYMWKREMMEEELTGFAHAFQNLAKTFWADATEPTQKDIPAMVNELTDSVCKGCGLAEYCWREDVNKTYPAVAKVLGDETIETITEKTFAQPFQETCVRLENFARKANRLMEMGRYKSHWEGKLGENRKLMGQQMAAVGEILQGIGRNVEEDIIFHEEKAKDILESCKVADMAVHHVRVTENAERGQRKVQIAVGGCGGVGVCRQETLRLVEREMGCKMALGTCPCPKDADKPCLLTFLEQPAYLLSTATAYIPATKAVTGDAASVLFTERGEGIMALSDGMGKGAEASKESVEAIELLEQFMEAGFDSELAVKLINSALLFGSGGETYATLDICHVDLFTGKGEFLKMGAVASYIYRGERLISVETHSLPAGILQQVEVVKREMDFRDGDLIFMMTDGITDVFGGEMALENWLREQLRKKTMSNPKDLANLLLGGAKGILAESPSARERMDDMMVLVGRFWKRL